MAMLDTPGMWIFYSDEDKNAKALFDALSVFWDGNIPEINNFAELQASGQIIQFGRPPNRIDLLNQIDGILKRLGRIGKMWN